MGSVVNKVLSSKKDDKVREETDIAVAADSYMLPVAEDTYPYPGWDDEEDIKDEDFYLIDGHPVIRSKKEKSDRKTSPSTAKSRYIWKKLAESSKPTKSIPSNSRPKSDRFSPKTAKVPIDVVFW